MRRYMRNGLLAVVLGLSGTLGVLGMFGVAGSAQAQSLPTRSGQVLDLPICSHIYHGDLDAQRRPQQTLLSAHVSIRNTNAKHALKLNYVRYYDTVGKLLKDYLRGALVIPPLGTHELFVQQSDVSGGSGANFLMS